MRKTFLLSIVLMCTMVQGAWATDYSVKDDAELRAAIADNGANITVTADIDLSNSTLSIAKGTTVTIDLGGHTLDRGLTARNYDTGGQVITVREGATLNLSNGTLKGGWGGNGGGIVNEEGTANLTNVSITGCTGDDRGGGIVNYGTMTIDGCTITGNTAKASGGSGIWQAGTLNIQGKNYIFDNFRAGGIRDNLYLPSGRLITVTGALTGNDIGVTMQTLGTFTSGFSTYNDDHPANFFTSDKQSITGMRLVGGEALLDNTIPEGGVYYIERSWNETAKRVEATFCTLEKNQYTTLTGGSGDTYLDPGWYVVKGSDVEYDDFLYMNDGGEYHLILCDGASLKAMFFIVNSPNVLHIHGQANNTGKMSNTYGTTAFYTHRYHAGIGSLYEEENGTIVIHGGDIDVHGGEAGPGIGNRSHEKHGDPITIYGGSVHAKGGLQTGSEGGGGGAGIGGGWNGDCGIVNIYGGSVYATGRGNNSGAAGIGSGSFAHNSGTITIYGGYVEATGDEGGAGIGSGYGTNGADVTIHGGTVNAYGKVGGPGIGAGVSKDYPISYAGTLTVTGGKVYAEGGTQRGAGIGGGWSTNGSTVTVSGGYVYAKGGKYAAGIGSGCEHSTEENLHGGTLTVTGGYVEAHGGEDGAGIGGGEDADGGNVTITGGIVVAQSGGDQRAIGAGYGSDNHGSLSFADNLGVFVSTDLYRSQKANRVIDCRNWSYVRVDKCAHGGHEVNSCKYCLVTDEELHTFGDYGECGVCGIIGLADNANNSDIIEHWDGATDKAVIISGRTLYKDGDWNTLTLPFEVGDPDASTGHWFDGTPLEGATVMALANSEGSTGFDPSSGTLTLYFVDANQIEAGVPYIVKWNATIPNYFENPVFMDVTIDKNLNDITSDDGKVSFKGNYAPETLPGGDASNLYLGSNNKLYWPSDDKIMNAFRAYFNVDLGASQIKQFDLNFDGATTGIGLTPTLSPKGEEDCWYDLQGRKVNAQLKKGIYINNGQKVVVK